MHSYVPVEAGRCLLMMLDDVVGRLRRLFDDCCCFFVSKPRMFALK